MSNGTEIIIAETWLYQQLADAQAAAALANPAYVPLEVHNEAVPQELEPEASAWPAIVIRSRPQKADSEGATGVIAWANLEYLVEVIGQDSTFAAVGAYLAIIHPALHRRSGPAAGGLVVSCVRVQPFKQREIHHGKPYQRLGLIYRLAVQAPEA